MIHKGLDSFRLFAFLAVFLFHVHLLEIGYLGVLAFFVLSGFLLTPILLDMRRTLSTRKYFVNFYGRRTLRIFPLYYFYLAGLGALALVGAAIQRRPAAIQQVGDQFVFAATYTYDFFHASRAYTFSPLLSHLWSLAVEEQFYLVWPLLILWAGDTRLRIVLMSLVIAGPIVRAGEAAVITSSMSALFYSRHDLVVYVLPFSHIDAFATGGYLALYGRTPTTGFVGLYAGALMVAGMIAQWYGGGAGSFLGYRSFMADSWEHVWGYTCWNLLFGWALLLIRGRLFFPKVMEHPVPVYLGRISYGLYVYHFAVLWLVSLTNVLKTDRHWFWQAAGIIGALGATIAVSIASYEYLEAPFLRIKDTRFSKTAV